MNIGLQSRANDNTTTLLMYMPKRLPCMQLMKSPKQLCVNMPRWELYLLIDGL